jgi:hypothetical protein
MTNTKEERIRAKEESLLGSLLAEFPTDLPENIQQMLLHAPGSFSEPLAGMAASAMRRLWKSGQTVDLSSVIKEAEAAGDIMEPSFLLSLLKSQIPMECADADAGEVFEEFRTRTAVKLLRANADRLEKHPEDFAPILSLAVSGIEELRTSSRPGDLPPIVDAMELCESKPKTPPEVVSGLAHQGSKMILGGGSKSHKTWTLIDLGLSVAYGLPWLGMHTTQGPVLYVNFELPSWSMDKRITCVSGSKGLKAQPGKFDVWNLRGYAASYDLLMPKIIARAKQKDYLLIILDPIYKIYGKLQENKTEDMALLMNSIDTLTTNTSAMVAFGAHFSKGNQAGKESMDRISGSGVFARDADSLLIMTAHKEPNAFSVESTLRNLKPLEPFVARWEFPLMRKDEGLNPADLKKLPGRPSKHNEAELLEVLGEGGMNTTEWQKACHSERGISRSEFYDIKRGLVGKKVTMDLNSNWRPTG